VTTPRWLPLGAETYPVARPELRCPWCVRPQPPLPRGVRTCVYCSAQLPVQRWRADPPPNALPPGASGRARPKARRRTYLGPPSYGGAAPRWGFPPVVWREAQVGDKEDVSTAPLTRLRIAGYLCWLTFAAAVAAAGGELWRYVLLLQGRTEVLSGPLVAASDRTVTSSALLATGCGLATAAVLVPALVGLHGASARRAGREPSRQPAGALARLVVPGWNLYGLGVVVGEIDGALTAPQAAGRPRMSRLVLLWWISWVVDAVLVLVTLARAFGRSEQAMADTVQLHIVVDLVAALVALLGALVCRRFLRLLRGPAAAPSSRWVVRPPEPTRVISEG